MMKKKIFLALFLALMAAMPLAGLAQTNNEVHDASSQLRGGYP